MDIMNILSSFLGCFFALLAYNLLGKAKKNKQHVNESQKRKVPVNIGKFADPLGEYEKYKDQKSNLYTTYVPKKNNRRGSK